MNEYIGKICPYCKTEFVPDDDVIVCSACDMPHHKDCWVENQGCTTFGCLGTIKAADDTVSSVTATQMDYEMPVSAPSDGAVFCTKCGTKNAGSAFFCSHCGNRLVTHPEQPSQPTAHTPVAATNGASYSYLSQQSVANQSQSGYQSSYANGYQSYQTTGVAAEMQQLIGTKTEYYIPRFQSMKSRNKSVSWNWPAFLITPYWMLYRKMYGYGAAILVADIIVSLIGTGFLSFLALGGYVACGIWGNFIYMKHLEGKADQARMMVEPGKSQYIASHGGVNMLAAILTLIGRVVLVSILLS